MSNLFKSILVPVDFTINTEVAVKKAVELSDKGTIIHLFHVETGTYDITSDNKIAQWKSTIELTSEHIKVVTSIVASPSVQQAIEHKAKVIGADLIIVGKNSHHSWFPFLNTVVPGALTEKTCIPVLTVKPGSIHSKIRRVIIPIGIEAAQVKLDMISTLSRKYKVNIHLVTFMNVDDKEKDINASLFIKAYQILKVANNLPVQYALLYGHNKAKAILNYAEKIDADILLVHRNVETKIGWPGKHISDMLLPSSKMHVIAL